MKLRPALWLGMLLVVLASSAHAQSSSGVDPYEEYGKRLRAAQEVTPLKSDLFGDQVSLYNGATEFDVTDIDLPGNSILPVQLRRRLVINDRRISPGNIAGMDDWDVDVPYIVGTFSQQNGWVVTDGNGNVTNARCTNQSMPYSFINLQVGNPYDLIWDGNQLHVPGAGDEEILKNTEAKLPALADGNSYPWLTKSYYRLGCLASTTGLAGESFYAMSPSGVKYTFNWATSRVAPPVKINKNLVPRVRMFLLATKAEDRFGNWVTYTYTDGDHLTKVAANDGREIDITWSGNTVTSATAGSRTWSYGYSNGALSSVTRPDGSAWHYSVVSGSLRTTKTYDVDDHKPPNDHCQIEPTPNTGALVYAVDAPSGAHATFTFNYQRHYRSGVPLACIDGNPNHLYPDVYNFFRQFQPGIQADHGSRPGHAQLGLRLR